MSKQPKKKIETSTGLEKYFGKTEWPTKHGIARLAGKVTVEMSEMIDSFIGYHLDNKIDGQFKKLYFLIDSPGGDFDSGVKITNTIQLYPGETCAINYATAASMATVIMQGCKVRIGDPKSRFLIHNPSINEVGCDNLEELDSKEFKDLLFRRQVISNRMFACYDRLNIKGDELAQFLKMDLFIDANKALEIGLIDSVEKFCLSSCL